MDAAWMKEYKQYLEQKDTPQNVVDMMLGTAAQAFENVPQVMRVRVARTLNDWSRDEFIGMDGVLAMLDAMYTADRGYDLNTQDEKDFSNTTPEEMQDYLDDSMDGSWEGYTISDVEGICKFVRDVNTYVQYNKTNR